MTLVIGHKGAPTLEAENTVASFARAKQLGADGVELDVRRTGGGELAVWHDPVLPNGRVLLDSSWLELDGQVDGLTAVLDACDGLDLVNVEIKNWPADDDFDASLGIADVVAAMLSQRDSAEWHRYVVSCFHLETLDRARDALDDVAPAVRTGWLMWGVDDVDKVVATASEHRHGALHPFFTAVTPELVEQAHAADQAINVWTCNDQDEVRRLTELEVDGIITDQPAETLRTVRGEI